MSMFEALENTQILGRQQRSPDSAGTHADFSLQSAVGNQAVARMLQREEDEEEMVQAKHDPSLAVQRADDVPIVEDEEDVPLVEDEEDVPLVQAKHDTGAVQRKPEVGLGGGAISDGLSSRINSARGAGSPLDAGTRTTMEDALGTSLSDVRVHVGGESDELNHAISAKAFTTGNDVFVRSDQWSPNSSSTQRLMAHELTHVAQQRSGAVDMGRGGMTVGAADSGHEQEADDVAEAVVSRSAHVSESDEPDSIR